MKNLPPYHDQLNLVEVRLAEVGEALLGNDADRLVLASQELQAIAVLVSKLFQQVPVAAARMDRGFEKRIKNISTLLASVREAVVRRNVVVELSLRALIPGSRSDTYSMGEGARSRKSYGSIGRQSGEFQVLTV
jgi:hypothetical protein